MDFTHRLLFLVLALPAFVVAFTVHEFAHAYVADKLGDDTARRAGKLTLDPWKQLDPIGSTFLVVTILLGWPMLGWASVPVNPRNFQNPRRDDCLVSVAGPLSNVAQALGWLFALVLVRLAAGAAGVSFSRSEVLSIVNRLPDPRSVWLALATMCAIGVILNLSLALFNMLPIPPFDGGFIAANLFPPLAPLYEFLRPFGFLIVLLLLQSQTLLQPMFAPVERLGAGWVLQALGRDPHEYSYGHR